MRIELYNYRFTEGSKSHRVALDLLSIGADFPTIAKRNSTTVNMVRNLANTLHVRGANIHRYTPQKKINTRTHA